MDTSKPSRIVLWVCMVIMYGITLFPNFGLSEALALFGYNRTKLASMYHVDIEPPRGMFLMWWIVFIWQVIWMAYTATLIFRSSEQGHLYYSPPFMNNYIYGAFLLASVFDFVWNILWGMEYVQYCFLCDLCLMVSLYVALSASFNGLRNHGQQLINEGKKKDIFLTIFLVQYGIGIYACHVSLTILLNFSALLSYCGNVDLKTSGAIALSILLIEMTIWFTLDTVFLDRYCRYFFLPYMEVIYFLSGVAANNWNSQAPNSIFTIILICMAFIYLVIKVALAISRSMRQTFFNWKGEVARELEEYTNERDPLIESSANISALGVLYS